MARIPNQSPINTTPEPAKADETKPAEPTAADSAKTSEPAKKILLAEAVNQLPDSKLSEIASLVNLKMSELGHTPVENCMSSISATMMSMTNVSLDGVSDNIEKLQKAYPSVLGIYKDPARDTKAKISGIASVFDSLA